MALPSNVSETISMIVGGRHISILILLGTVTAIVLGVLFAFTPVFAKSENASPAA